MKRVLTVQDISCIGRCSLTVAQPIISVLGSECAVLPTAVLSAHTAFASFVSKDLTDEIPKIEDAWERTGMAPRPGQTEDAPKDPAIRFDAIYSGYLASSRQIDLVEDLWRRFSGVGALHIVDPAMADDGALYAGFDASFVDRMKELVSHADVTLPNVTELCLLTDTPCRKELSSKECRDLVLKLHEKGAGSIVLTGYTAGTRDRIGALIYDGAEGTFSEHLTERAPAFYHGTGDIFASVVTGAMVAGMSLTEGASLAADFVAECIKKTLSDPDKTWYGVSFERAIPYLMERMQRAHEKE